MNEVTLPSFGKNPVENTTKKNLQDKQIKLPPAVKQYKIIQAGTLVKSSIEMLSFHVYYSCSTLGLHVSQPRVSR